MNREIIEEVYTAEVEHVRKHTLSVLFDLVERAKVGYDTAFASTYRAQFFTLFTNKLVIIDGDYVYPTAKAYELARTHNNVTN